MASRNVGKTRARLEKRIEEGSYYEAHQQLRVVSQRYVKAGDFEAAIDILCSGAQALFKAGQSGSGGDLCLLLLEVYKTGAVKPSAQSKARLFELLTSMPPEEPTRKRFINEIIAWSSKMGEFPAGDPELHHFIGTMFAREDDAYNAEKHLLVGTKESAEILGKLLYKWYAEDEAHTAPEYAARAVFGYLLTGNLRDASRSLEAFTQELVRNSSGLTIQEVESTVSDVRVFPSLPLLNFLNLLILAAQRGGAELFRNLKSHYANNLKEVQSWDEALDQVGEAYFGIQVRRPQNLFDMMGSIFGGPPSAQQPSRAAQIAAESQSGDLD
ncbi:hypothetical protein RUND412_002460 [Rhizina undulata]